MHLLSGQIDAQLKQRELGAASHTPACSTAFHLQREFRKSPVDTLNDCVPMIGRYRALDILAPDVTLSHALRMPTRNVTRAPAPVRMQGNFECVSTLDGA